MQRKAQVRLDQKFQRKSKQKLVEIKTLAQYRIKGKKYKLGEIEWALEWAFGLRDGIHIRRNHVGRLLGTRIALTNP